ncbi:TauD/TfdA family dioxygenase [Roseiarcaceae bacterium H3SJ34-1]|uniref:TauD/TfdA dioxygenase family protein n=1 Tax=Terripilifer ovatus TaxID=3032367 RepID=UPI003AB999CA|nr:TauD/TfdA family dioxygenase [Roseiarcaceae bacterium H3SJ34-1]
MTTTSATAVSGQSPSTIRLRKIAPHLGAEVTGIDLALPISDADAKTLDDALAKHEVLVFKNQKLDVDQYMSFGRVFGSLTVHPFSTALIDRPELIVLDNDADSPPLSTDQWHTDEAFREKPAKATILRATIIPELGGNTVFTSMTAAYDGLNPALQEFLCRLEALHDFKVFRILHSRTREGRQKLVDIEDIFPNQRHPVVRVHPVTGRRAVFVSPQTTKSIIGLRDFESESMLQMLYQLPKIPEYQLRIIWEPDMIVVWDNRSTQHYAPRDYFPERRRMERLTVGGDRPVGVNSGTAAAAAGDVAPKNVGRYREGLARPTDSLLAKG